MSSDKQENTKDTDLENKNSEIEEEEADLDLDEEDVDSEDDEESLEDDDQPMTKKEFREFQQSIKNSSNASRRIASKRELQTKAPKENERLDRIEQAVKRTELLEQKRQFGYENHLSPTEVDYVFKLSKRPTKKFLDDPFIKGGLESLRSRERTKVNTPGMSGGTFKNVEGKSWTDLKDGEKQQNFNERRKALLENGGK